MLLVKLVRWCIMFIMAPTILAYTITMVNKIEMKGGRNGRRRI
jgi:hypothetical protein